MNRSYLDFLQADVEIPDCVTERAKEALALVWEGAAPAQEAGRRRKAGKARYLRAAAIVLACLLVPGVTVAAGSALNAYWSRMDALDEEQIEYYYDLNNNAETTLFNRRFTAAEEARWDALKARYRNGELLPDGQILLLAGGEAYGGDTVAMDEAIRTIYLPERELTDEELLQIIDVVEKMYYSVRVVNQVGYGMPWRERMEEMTAEEVDQVYFVLCSNHCATSGGCRRPLTEAEEARYRELETAYEEQGMYPLTACGVVLNLVDLSGEALEICIQDGNYHLPERELTDEELLQIIDMRHRQSYCFERLQQDLERGIRTEYPKSPYQPDKIDTQEEFELSGLTFQQVDPYGRSLEEVEQMERDYALDGVTGYYACAEGYGLLVLKPDEKQEKQENLFWGSLYLSETVSIHLVKGEYEDGVLTISGMDADRNLMEGRVTFEDGRASLIFTDYRPFAGEKDAIVFERKGFE